MGYWQCSFASEPFRNRNPNPEIRSEAPDLNEGWRNAVVGDFVCTHVWYHTMYECIMRAFDSSVLCVSRSHIHKLFIFICDIIIYTVHKHIYIYSAQAPYFCISDGVVSSIDTFKPFKATRLQASSSKRMLMWTAANPKPLNIWWSIPHCPR